MAVQLSTPGAFSDDRATAAVVDRLGKVSERLTQLRRDLTQARDQASAAAEDAGGAQTLQVQELQQTVASLQGNLSQLQDEQAQLHQRLASKDSVRRQVRAGWDPRCCLAGTPAAAVTPLGGAYHRLAPLHFFREFGLSGTCPPCTPCPCFKHGLELKLKIWTLQNIHLLTRPSSAYTPVSYGVPAGDCCSNWAGALAAVCR